MIKEKIIIYGYTAFTKELIETIDKRFFDILVVEPNNANFIKARQEGHLALKLSLLDDEELDRIEITSSTLKSFVVASENQHDNLFVTLSARALNADLSIIALSESEHKNKQFYLAGASIVINPTSICGQRIARLISKPLVVDVLDSILFGSFHINLHEYIVEKSSKLNSLSIYNIDFNLFNLILLGLQDRELNDRFIFGTFEQNHRLDTNDVLVLLGKDEDFKKFIKFYAG
ncbi:MAG: NAD-binding protein [Epsilonproteobacteria bacterium]|nr:NAD-binding protein [Campylobacterota bacterium]MBD3839938.1 NAD-binding protein [Campylobacterota bacterium]